MPPPPSRPRPAHAWVETETGNKVSRLAQLHGTQHITLGGRCVISPHVCIRGDLARSAPTSSSTNTSTAAGAGAAGQGAAGQGAGAGPQRRKAGSVTSVLLGKYVVIRSGTLLRPPSRLVTSSSSSSTPNASSHPTTSSSPASQQTLQYHPLTISSHTHIGQNCTIQAASIGEHVVIEEGCVVGNMAIIRDGVRVLRGSVVGAHTVIPPSTIVGGRPARIVGENPVGWGVDEDDAAEGGQGGDLREVWRGVGREVV